MTRVAALATVLSGCSLLVSDFDPPEPDAAASLAERERLFDLPRSSWSDYDPALISKGGGIFSRADKSISLTKERSSGKVSGRGASQAGTMKPPSGGA